ncbi:MAG: LysE family translocator [Hyphomicrobiaceae bacterium]|nr:LysE family translocator [Hyphomicrobiaceae bacterium]
MIEAAAWYAYLIVVAGFVITPGPNVAYIVSRSVAQGQRAGLISAFGVMWGYVFYLLAAALGLTALLVAVPAAYEAIRWAGVAYLLWLAWGAFTGEDARGAMAGLSAPEASERRLMAMGFATNLLNPNIAMFYLSLLPQFVDPSRGNVFGQYLLLGATHIVAQAAVHIVLVVTAGRLASHAASPRWMAAQRYVLGTVLAALAVKLVFDRRPV